MNIDREDFTYDAFVIYPEEDSDFVHDKLLPKLENENNLRVCIHPRDFQPGKSIIENIVESIANSKRVFAVISQNFNQSKWCNFELLIAQDRWLNNEASVPLIIMRQEMDNAWIKREIRALVKTTTYAKWTEDVCGQELFLHQIISSVKDG
ncbi:hypothetical protein FSP39_024480 [Pinctada imbricata]|uniref:TIR domain-containing protein n=1 Tax=Pinctada imbricata TaxID=66713 RepID=A0AA88XY06_PINIB|nr:hypothetical protein FSP39_024480 [Pinctada imbricata]